jgi:hypothetical protein
MVSAKLAPNVAAVEQAASGLEMPLTAVVPALLAQAARIMRQEHLPALARMVIGESRTFPDLATVWHDDIVARLLAVISGLIARAQARGEIRAVDARLAAFSLMGPLLMAVLFREVFAGASKALPDLDRLAAQHADLLLNGLLTEKGE